MESQDASKPILTDEQLQRIIGNLLRTGVIAAALTVLAGGIAFLLRHHGDVVSYASFHLEQSNLRSLSGIFRSVMGLQPEAIIQSGLVLLIATPVARVALAALGFYLEGDRLYLSVSLIVLSILLFSIFHGV